MRVGEGRRFRIRAHEAKDLSVVVAREGAVYAEQFGWTREFEELAGRIVSQFAVEFAPGMEQAWVAEFVNEDGSTGGHAGHVFLVRHPEREGVAKLRLLLVEPAAQGMGLGRALVRECVGFAREAGYQTITLWTQSMLKAAIRIYESEGFKLVSEEAHHSFGQDLVGQMWELEL
jgi:GNAT superfamily N-acetyltransferase